MPFVAASLIGVCLGGGGKSFLPEDLEDLSALGMPNKGNPQQSDAKGTWVQESDKIGSS